MKPEKSETLRKQAEKELQAQKQADAALRESEERFQLVAAASELKRDSPNPKGQSRTASHISLWVG